MDKRTIFRRIYTLAAAGISILLQTFMIAFIWYYYYNPIIRIPFWSKGHWFITAIYFMVLLFFSHIYGGLNIGYQKKEDLLFSQIFSALCANIVFYLEICLLTYGFPTIIPLVMSTLAQILFIILWSKLIIALHIRLFPPHHVLLICKSGTEDTAIAKLNSRADKFMIKQVMLLSDDTAIDYSAINPYSAVVFWDIPGYIQSGLLKYCYRRGIRIYTNPKLSEVITSGAEVMHFFDTPLLLIRNSPLTPEQLIFKRLFDILFSLLLVLISAPIMLITALCIKGYDRGPILYRQVRCTLHEKPFYIYKFRSMILDAEKDGIARLANQHDSRITPIGSFIRKVRIDELPQLFNILRGDMSFIGPRPERPEIILQYQDTLPEFSFRTKVKAGLTGYAQIYGKYNTLPYDKLKLDLFYIGHYSLWLDIKLLILTAKIVFSLESTEGVQNDTTPHH